MRVEVARVRLPIDVGVLDVLGTACREAERA